MKPHEHSHHDDRPPRDQDRKGESRFRGGRFDEGDVLAFVEGELDAPRLVEFHEALERHPEVRAMVEAMRAQRDVLASFEDERAPADLMSRVGEALQAHPEPIAIARQPGVVHVRANPLRIFAESRTGRRVAAAAALLMVAGVGIMLVGRVIEKTPIGETRSGFDVPLAMNSDTPAPSYETLDAGSPLVAGKVDSLAIAVPAAGGQEPTPIKEPSLALVDPISPERASELALVGRLALRVVGTDGRTAQAVQRIADQSDGSGTWRMRSDVPRAIVTALAPAAAPINDRTGPMLADDSEQGNEYLIERSNDAIPPDVYLLESAGTAEALAGAREALSARVHAPVEFIELDEPIETPAVVDTQSVLWWNTPIAEWGTRIAVPVIVEHSER